MPRVALRPIEDADADALFEQDRDPESVWMAAFTREDPDDRAAFDARLARLRAAPDKVLLAITSDGELAGTIGYYAIDGHTEIAYWIDRAQWGRGIASAALALLLEQVPTRPLRARVASDNKASLRILEKAGFRPVGTEVSYANARAAEIEETILFLG